jgi:hypothetical protein
VSSDSVVEDLDVFADGVTGLGWRDLTETTSLSVADVQADVGGWASLGFVHGTTAQLITFFSNAGIPHIGPGFTSENFVPATSLMGLLGLSFTPSIAQGSIGLDEPGVGSVYGSRLQLDTFSSTAEVDPTKFNFTQTFSASTMGHFLVRPVPEPTTALLLATGLAGLAVRRQALG